VLSFDCLLLCLGVGVGVGGSLVSAKLVDEGRFDEITATAKAYVEALAR